MNFPGRRVYPLQTLFSPARDACKVERREQTEAERGDTKPPYDARVRGVTRRIEKPRG